MKKMYQMKLWMLAAVLMCGFGLLLTSCSDNDNEPNGNGDDNLAGQVVLMYYAIGGGNLDDDTEEALANMGLTLANDNRVRTFVQYKYSAERNNTSWDDNYQPSGEYGSVYRFELNSSSINPYYKGLVKNAKAFAGPGFTKFAGKDFKMYEPDNLTQFVNWCMAQAPGAKAYVLAFGDHGGAYNLRKDYNKALKTKALTRGVMYDDNLSGEPCMSPAEIASALDKVTRKPDMIYFDCCLMNNLEVLGELQGRTQYVFASGHSVMQGPLYELGNALAGVASSSNVSQGLRAYMSNFVSTITQVMEKRYKNRTGNRIRRSQDYTLTDMSKLPALFASIKAVTDFLAAVDISGYDRAKFNQAASGCYQYVDSRPFFDILGYLNQLKENVFTDNAEFASLVAQVKTAAEACHVAHGEFSYDKDGTNRKYGLTYSVTLGFSSKCFSYINEKVQAKAPAEPVGVIMYTIRGGKGTGADPYYNDYYFENGDNFLASWVEGQEYNIINIDRYWASDSGDHLSWDNSYRTMQFDKATGWSRWMKKNPGIHFDNPPYDDEYTYVIEDPDWSEILDE